jgi:hypothetical protein
MPSQACRVFPTFEFAIYEKARPDKAAAALAAALLALAQGPSRPTDLK